MDLMHLNHRQAAALRRLRRRTWAVIALCLLFRFGDAALHAEGPADLPNHLFSSERYS